VVWWGGEEGGNFSYVGVPDLLGDADADGFCAAAGGGYDAYWHLSLFFFIFSFLFLCAMVWFE